MYGIASDPFTGAGVTALGLAASRAVESSRTDRLVDDPHARVLFDAAGADLPMRTTWPAAGERVTDTEALHLHGSRYIGMRTRFYDDVLVAAAAAGTRQAVLLGAGLDTRVRRLGLPPGFAVYELDRAQVLDFKRRVLGDAAARAVGAELSGDWTGPLRDAGFAGDRPTAWLAEGLLPYLDAGAQARLIEAVDALSAAGSTFAFDHLVGGDVEDLSRRSGIDMDSLLAGTADTGLAARLADRGWSVTSTAAEELGRRYRRDLANPFGTGTAESPPWLQTQFVEAQLRGCRSERR